MSRTELARRTLEELSRIIPSPTTELVHEDPYELIVAVILSAQCTDARVNLVTPGLFRAYPTVLDLARAEPPDVFRYISSISFPNNKSKHLVAMARKVVDEYGGKIPDTIEELMTLPGVGRKSAQVVASVAYDRAALPVDTHVFRVANRIGLVYRADTPLKVELQLKRIIPKAQWSDAHHYLILHGRYNCTARKPNCGACPLTAFCRSHQSLARLPGRMEGLDPRRGKYYCRTRRHYFEEGDRRTDRHGVEQICCPKCGSMNVFSTRTGESVRRVRDYRV